MRVEDHELGDPLALAEHGAQARFEDLRNGARVLDQYADLGVISSQLYPDWFDSPEGKEGAAAFLEKREPNFTGR